MRSDTEIGNEIVALKNALSKQDRWNDRARETLKETIEVLQKRMTIDQIDAHYYVDETSDEFEEGDNDLHSELTLVAYWLRGDFGFDAPSKRL